MPESRGSKALNVRREKLTTGEEFTRASTGRNSCKQGPEVGPDFGLAYA